MSDGARLPDELVDELVAAAREVRRRAYAPYSDFAVGAAVLAGGTVFSGVNVENASYPLSVCAERNAVAAAVAAGESRLDAVAIAGSKAEPIAPCGGCRQVLREFASVMLVVSEGLDGRRAQWTLADLLPKAYGADRLR